MKHKVKIIYSIFILFVLYPFDTYAQDMKLARAKGRVHFICIYKKDNHKMILVDSIPKDYFFYCKIDNNSKWYKVYDVYYNEKGGYVYKDSIDIIDYLPSLEKKKIILAVFDSKRNLLNKSNDTSYKKDKHEKFEERLDNYIWDTYIPICKIFYEYYNKKRDTSILRQFIETMDGANEIEIGILSNCFILDTATFRKTLKNFDREEIKGIANMIDFGLKNQYSSDKKEDSLELKKYEKELDNISKR